MTYRLFIADYAYSSWSLRGWLLFDAFGIPTEIRYAHMRTGDFTALQDAMAPSRQVPALEIAGEGEPLLVWDSLAMAETLAERHPEAGLWPAEPDKRASARSIAAEMHSGFQAMRRDCPMNLRRAYGNFAPAEDVQADLARLEALWSYAKLRHGMGGPYLFGQAFTAADAFLVPLASRIATYGLTLGNGAGGYAKALVGHLSFRRWRAMAMADGHRQAHYEFDHAEAADPYRPARIGRAVTGQGAENANCPFSGKPVSPDALVEIQGRVIGFCNTFCRDKVAADPDAWPEVAALLGS